MLSSASRSQLASRENLGHREGFSGRGEGPQGVIKRPARSPQDLFGFGSFSRFISGLSSKLCITPETLPLLSPNRNAVAVGISSQTCKINYTRQNCILHIVKPM